ncbi:hypothetical protein ACXO18_02070 [Lactobacillus delbrueckii subsp. bulgaricus]
MAHKQRVAYLVAYLDYLRLVAILGVITIHVATSLKLLPAGLRELKLADPQLLGRLEPLLRAVFYHDFRGYFSESGF